MYLLIWAFTALIATVVSARDTDSTGDYLGDLTWPQAERRIESVPIVIVPVAAGAKEHGPHLPMDVDHRVLTYLLEHAAQKRDVLIVPPVLHGWFPAFRDFPGTEIASPAVFQNYMTEIAQSLVKHGARRILFLNTGISKATGLPLSIVAREIRSETGTPTLVVSWDDLENDEVAAFSEQQRGGHADEIETSIMLFLAPEAVSMEHAVTDYGAPTVAKPGYEPGIFSRDPADPKFSRTGLFGDPTLATAEKGQRTLEIMTRELLRAIDGFVQTPIRSVDEK